MISDTQAGLSALSVYLGPFYVPTPDRTIPRATMAVVIFIGLFYAVASWALISGLGTSQAVRLSHADPSGVFFPVARSYCGAFYYHLVSTLILSSMFAANLAVHNVTTRYIYSLSVDGIFPHVLGVAHERHRSPHRASITVSALYFFTTASPVLFGLTAEQIYSRFTGVAAFGLNCAMAITSLAAIVFFARDRRGMPLWQVQIAPFIALLGLCAMAYLSEVNLPILIGGSRTIASTMTAVGIGLFLAGMCLALWLKVSRPDVYLKIGRQTG